MMGSQSGHLACLLMVLVALALCPMACGGGEHVEFSDQLLYKLFYKEPNSHSQLLGNVRRCLLISEDTTHYCRWHDRNA